ncbi:hypothetical protein COCNU_03G004430 [Cocos nucifera]|uniref:Uncharacterized protein n=1 Tax=Cocos nucifera TaxID=13894 RepID=A0A8K0I2H6_COCNU|nr:hypothetical protein COCNU_03G004430 [Cocos nucifera]
MKVVEEEMLEDAIHYGEASDYCMGMVGEDVKRGAGRAREGPWHIGGESLDGGIEEAVGVKNKKIRTNRRENSRNEKAGNGNTWSNEMGSIEGIDGKMMVGWEVIGDARRSWEGSQIDVWSKAA